VLAVAVISRNMEAGSRVQVPGEIDAYHLQKAVVMLQIFTFSRLPTVQIAAFRFYNVWHCRFTPTFRNGSQCSGWCSPWPWFSSLPHTLGVNGL